MVAGSWFLVKTGAHEGAAEVVPAVHDDDVELGVGGEGFAEVGDGRGGGQALAVPEAADFFVGEQVGSGRRPSSRR